MGDLIKLEEREKFGKKKKKMGERKEGKPEKEEKFGKKKEKMGERKEGKPEKEEKLGKKKEKINEIREEKSGKEDRKYIRKGKKACGLHCIRMNDFSVKIGDNQIIEDINLHIHCGNLTAIIGKNGAGKTTLVKAMLGEIKHEGTIEFKDIKNDSFGKLRIGYVPQYLNVDKNTPTNVYDLFASFISRRPVFFRRSGKIEELIKKQLGKFDATELLSKAVCDLSGGELQRVLLSMAIYNEPNLLILDEPASGMDHNGMELFYRNINRLLKNYDVAVIMVSHDLSYVEKYADHVILLDKKILKEGTPKQVFESKEFREVFGERFV